MWTMLAIAGRWLWPAIAGLAPEVTPKLTIALLAGLLALVAIGAPAGAVWLHMRALRTAAVDAATAARDAHWQTEITKANQTHAEKLEAARRAAEAVAATPADLAERMRVCKASPTCREHRR